MGFFHQYDRFYGTSRTSPQPARLNGRHAAIIAANAVHLAGARVLDIGSHDGRWSFAALHAGAAHVTGVEPRAGLVASAKDTFAHYGVAAERYDFECRDVFASLAEPRTFDVVLCLGFYYHTVRHAELFHLMERTGARCIVIDTEVTPPADRLAPGPPGDPRMVHGNPNAVQLLREPVAEEQMAWEDMLTRDGHTLVGRPSPAAVEFLAAHFGFATARHDWPAYLAVHPSAAAAMHDYAAGCARDVHRHAPSELIRRMTAFTPS